MEEPLDCCFHTADSTQLDLYLQGQPLAAFRVQGKFEGILTEIDLADIAKGFFHGFHSLNLDWFVLEPLARFLTVYI